MTREGRETDHDGFDTISAILYGWSAEEILRQHPDLRPGQVYAALTYFYDHHESMVRQMRDMSLAAEREASKQPLSRAEPLKRRAALGS